MTLLEVIVFVLLVYGIYRLLKPLQKKLETQLKKLEEIWGKHGQ